MPRRRFMAGAASTGAGLTAISVVGCGSDDEDAATAAATATAVSTSGTASQTAASTSPRQGGRLRFAAQGEPSSLDPYAYITQADQSPASLWYSRLFRYESGPGIGDTEYIVKPDVAASLPEFADEGTTLVVKLRPNVRFHNKAPVNGRAIVAEDITYTLERFRAVSVRAASFNIVDSVETPDTETVVFHLKTPSASFLSTITDGSFLHIVPREIIGSGNHAEGDPVGSGPWIFNSYDQNVKLTGRANPDHVHGRPNIDDFEMLIIPELSAQAAAFRSGQLDLIAGIPQSELASIKSVSGATVQQGIGSLWSLNFDLTGVFGDVRMRRAASMAIDRDGLNKAIYDGQAQLSTLLPAKYAPWSLDPGVESNYPGTYKNLHYNKAEASRLIKEAGYSGQSLKLGSASRYDVNAIELVAAYLTDAGLNMNIDLKEYAAFLETFNKGKIDGGLGYVPYAHYPDPSAFLNIYWHPNSVNLKTPYTDADIGRLIEEQDRTINVQERASKIHEIQRIFADRAYTVFLVSAPTARATGSRLKDYYYINNVSGYEGLSGAWLDA
ncbi:MAG: ABC transporter substrate-binding protein [Dehalococcoidia bacterium]